MTDKNKQMFKDTIEFLKYAKTKTMSTYHKSTLTAAIDSLYEIMEANVL